MAEQKTKTKLRINIGQFHILKDQLRALGKDHRHVTIAKGCDVTREHFSRVLVGNERPSRKMARKLVEYFNKKLGTEMELKDLFEEIIL